MSQNLGVSILNPGGSQAIGPLTAVGAIKSSAISPTAPGRLRRINVQSPGTAGAFSFFDCNFQGAFSNTTQYLPGQGVTSGGNVFICIAPTLGNATSNATFWAQLAAVLAIEFGEVGAGGGLLSPDWPFANGIYLGAIPSAGTPAISVSFD